MGQVRDQDATRHEKLPEQVWVLLHHLRHAGVRVHELPHSFDLVVSLHEELEALGDPHDVVALHVPEATVAYGEGVGVAALA